MAVVSSIAGWPARRIAIVVNSAAIRDDCVEHGLPREKFTVIPNGVEPARASDVSRAELLAGIALPAGCAVDRRRRPSLRRRSA